MQLIRMLQNVLVAEAAEGNGRRHKLACPRHTLAQLRQLAASLRLRHPWQVSRPWLNVMTLGCTSCIQACHKDPRNPKDTGAEADQ